MDAVIIEQAENPGLETDVMLAPRASPRKTSVHTPRASPRKPDVHIPKRTSVNIPEPSLSTKGGQKHPRSRLLLLVLLRLLIPSKLDMMIPPGMRGDLGIVQERMPGQNPRTNHGTASDPIMGTIQLNRRQGQEKGKGKGQRQGRGQNKSYGHPQAGYQPKGGSSGKSQEKGKKKDKSYRDRTSSPNSLPLGQRTASRSRAPEDKDSRAADFDDYNYWSQAIHKVRADTSRIPILAEMLPDQMEPPRAIDQDEVQTISSIIQVKDTEVPENISQHMAEILLTKIPC